ncbi:hypothetical protein [Rhodopirellula sp. MGV]|nr:hypothetical protein [Rhodopirellula sp. MGV]
MQCRLSSYALTSRTNLLNRTDRFAPYLVNGVKGRIRLKLT